jgi:hypothetical protein
MNFPGVRLITPDLLEESWRELERERAQRRRIQEARDARRAERPSRFATLTARLRHALQTDELQPDPCAPVAETS